METSCDGRRKPCRASRGRGTARTSDAATLGRADAVVRLRRHVVDRADLEAGGLEGADRGLAAGARALDDDVDPLPAVLLRLARSGLGSELRGERGRLAGPLEADAAGRGPADHS